MLQLLLTGHPISSFFLWAGIFVKTKQCLYDDIVISLAFELWGVLFDDIMVLD